MKKNSFISIPLLFPIIKKILRLFPGDLAGKNARFLKK